MDGGIESLAIVGMSFVAGIIVGAMIMCIVKGE